MSQQPKQTDHDTPNEGRKLTPEREARNRRWGFGQDYADAGMMAATPPPTAVPPRYPCTNGCEGGHYIGEDCFAPTAAPEPPPQLPYAADWEPLWTVCSNLESILLREPRQDYPEAFSANLKRAFALLRDRYALPPSPNAEPEGLIGDNYRQAAAPVPTAVKMPSAESTSVTFGATDHCRKCGVHLLEDNSEDVRGLCDKCAPPTAEGPRGGGLKGGDTAAALERAAQIAEERYFHTGRTIAAEIRKLAKEIR